jgi:hypothetical protein
LRRLLRIKPANDRICKTFGNTCTISAIPTSKARFSHTCFLSVWNFGARIYAALATSTVDLYSIFILFWLTAIFDKHMTSKQSAAVSGFMRQTILDEVGTNNLRSAMA